MTTPAETQIQTLTLANLVNLDRGAFEAAVNDALERLGDDLADRKTVKTRRKLEIKLEFAPEVDDTGALIGALSSWEIGCKIPVRKSKEMRMDVDSRGQLSFVGLSPENPRQPHLGFYRDDEDGPPDEQTDAATL